MVNAKNKRSAGNTDANVAAIRRLNLGRLIVPLDGTIASESVLPYALMMAKWWDSEIVLLHIIRTLRESRQVPGERVLYPDVHHDRGVQLASAYLEEVSKKLKLHGVQVRWGVATGDTAFMVVSRTLASRAGMMIMRSRIRTVFELSWDRPFERIWQATPVPIFTVNRDPANDAEIEVTPPGSFVIAVSSKDCIETITPYFKAVANMFSAPPVHIVYPLKRVRRLSITPAVPPIADTELDQMVADLESAGSEVSVTFTPDILDTVGTLNSVHESAWVITTSHLRAPIQRIAFRSLAYNLVKQHVSPVLVIPNSEVSSKRRQKAHINV